MTPEAAIEAAHRAYDTRPGWTWTANPVPGAPGWYSVSQRGPGPRDILIGGRTVVGPHGVVVALSSNPFIHAFDVVDQVLAEVGDTEMSGQAIADEIARRTAALRAQEGP